MRSVFRRSLVVAMMAVAALMVSAASAGAATVVVDSNGDSGWSFAADPTNAVPYEFTTDEQSIGSGSLHVPPLPATPAKKFIGELPLGTLVSDLESISFDFLIDDEGTSGATTYKQFYLNVYVNGPSMTGFGQCRYDYVATSGSTSAWSTVTATPTATPDAVVDRNAGDGFTCTPTLDGLAAGSTIRAFTLNVGDTTASDAGVGGYLDNVVVSQTGGSTTYDFEASPSSKDQCKKGGWEAFGFSNQGQCVSFVESNRPS